MLGHGHSSAKDPWSSRHALELDAPGALPEVGGERRRRSPRRCSGGGLARLAVDARGRSRPR
eukprot:5519987-Alexandrium_andersonii.AAC.1